MISIHTPHTRCDSWVFWHQASARFISIHTPHTRCDVEDAYITLLDDISIHTPHTRCDIHYCNVNGHTNEISIHTPHTRCDFHSRFNFSIVDFISIHTPHTRCDRLKFRNIAIYLLFQSTHLIRGVTVRRGRLLYL